MEIGEYLNTARKGGYSDIAAAVEWAAVRTGAANEVEGFPRLPISVRAAAFADARTAGALID